MRRRPKEQSFGGQGVHREMESERHEENYRAVIDGGYAEDEPVGRRWGKVESALWRRRRSHSPIAPRCLRTARQGRTTRDLRRTGRVSGDTGVNGPISESAGVSEALSVDGRLCVVPEAWRKSRDRAIGNRNGLGKAVGEDGWGEKENQMSKGGKVEQFHE